MSASSAPLPLQTHSNRFWSDPQSVPRLAVLLLNAPLAPHWRLSGPPALSPSTNSDPPTSELFRSLWNNAELRMCADGGANRLFDGSTGSGGSESGDDVLPPHCIKGDLDSLREDVRAFYAARGALVERDPGQDSNDLDKCLELIFARQEREPARGRFAVVIFGALGGRLDQEMQNLNALFCWHDRFQQLALLSEDATARLLLPGARHVIEPNFAFETRTCGLIPLAGACAATTTAGLQWDLRGQEMRFGGLISSSNHVADGHAVVHVENSHPLVWTTELRK
ncbi:hypothetical protein PybrP1_009033 [[Pythium] brassicae (nom. inval.)]|nr:hypothetical protein PybrP1_009033 [[Pythium] brassicae (nom. inval.)]